MKTSYSDSDFKIKFKRVAEISTYKTTLVVFTDGSRRFGYLRKETPGKVRVVLDDETEIVRNLNELTGLQELSDSFIGRFSAAIDFGLVFTKANNTTTFTVGGQLDYKGTKWFNRGVIDLLNTKQDSAERIERVDASLESIRLAGRKLFGVGRLGYLSNTEQALNSRVNISVGVGRFIVSNNKMYFNVTGGYNYNLEDFTNDQNDKKSSELFVSASFNMFDYEDISLSTDLKAYPSLSESGRFRLDYDLNIKYDLPLSFYVKLGFTLNYDNQSAVQGNEVDYIFKSGLGWEFN